MDQEPATTTKRVLIVKKVVKQCVNKSEVENVSVIENDSESGSSEFPVAKIVVTRTMIKVKILVIR